MNETRKTCVGGTKPAEDSRSKCDAATTCCQSTTGNEEKKLRFWVCSECAGSSDVLDQNSCYLISSNVPDRICPIYSDYNGLAVWCVITGYGMIQVVC